MMRLGRRRVRPPDVLLAVGTHGVDRRAVVCLALSLSPCSRHARATASIDFFSHDSHQPPSATRMHLADGTPRRPQRLASPARRPLLASSARVGPAAPAPSRHVRCTSARAGHARRFHSTACSRSRTGWRLEFWPRRRVDAESSGVVGLGAATCPCRSACVAVSLRLSSAAGWRFGSCIYTPAACCTGGALLSPVHGDRRARSRTATRDRPLARPAAAISCVGDEATFVMYSRWCGVPGAEPLCTTCLRRSVPPRHAFLVLFDYHRLATPAPERI
jgi:hypothetical protein